jgi:hypothetical protein
MSAENAATTGDSEAAPLAGRHFCTRRGRNRPRRIQRRHLRETLLPGVH